METEERPAYFSFTPFFLAAFSFITISVMAAGIRPAMADGKTHVLLVSGASIEDCSPVAPGQALNYAFHATGPVAFEIHYHEHGKTIAVFRVAKPLKEFSGKYTPKVKRSYCLRWFNTTYEDLSVVYTRAVTGR